MRSQLSQVLAAVVSIKLVERADGSGRIAALEILRNTPKVAKIIEVGKVADIREEIESSVSLYKMQTMNQSLISLLVHQTITYEEAMKMSPDPDDLSLKLRSMFPNLVTNTNKDDEMSSADFSEILELQEFKKMYHDQESHTKVQFQEKEEQIRAVQAHLADRDNEILSLREEIAGRDSEIEKLKGDFGRLKSEAQQKIDKLMERIKELNQRLVG